METKYTVFKIVFTEGVSSDPQWIYEGSIEYCEKFLRLSYANFQEIKQRAIINNETNYATPFLKNRPDALSVSLSLILDYISIIRTTIYFIQ